jgi:hypothetical protein
MFPFEYSESAEKTRSEPRARHSLRASTGKRQGTHAKRQVGLDTEWAAALQRTWTAGCLLLPLPLFLEPTKVIFGA